MASTESATLQNCMAELELAIRINLKDIATFLHTKKILLEETYYSVTDVRSVLRPEEKACEVLCVLRNKVEEDKGVYKILMEFLLKRPQYSTIAGTLKKEYARLEAAAKLMSDHSNEGAGQGWREEEEHVQQEPIRRRPIATGAGQGWREEEEHVQQEPIRRRPIATGNDRNASDYDFTDTTSSVNRPKTGRGSWCTCVLCIIIGATVLGAVVGVMVIYQVRHGGMLPPMGIIDLTRARNDKPPIIKTKPSHESGKKDPSSHYDAVPNHQDPTENTNTCTEIKQRRYLEKELAQVSDVPMKKCEDLGIKRFTCINLDLSKNHNYELANAYMRQHPEPCWENIIRVFCEDFSDPALAKGVQEKYGVPKHTYFMYCSE